MPLESSEDKTLLLDSESSQPEAIGGAKASRKWTPTAAAKYEHDRLKFHILDVNESNLHR